MKPAAWRSILVAISDPARRSQPALRKAAAVAARCGARVTLFNAFMFPPPPHAARPMSSAAILETARAQRLQQMETLARSMRKKGIKTRCRVEWDFPAHEAIVRCALKIKPDVMFADSTRHSAVARWLLANTDWELIRACPCPLWFVKTPGLPDSPLFLTAVDPRHAHAKPANLDARLLNEAQRGVRQLGGQLHIAHTYEPPMSTGSATFAEPFRLPLPPERARRFERETRRLIDALARRHGVTPARRHLSVGDPVTVLPELARKVKANVLVMGAVSRSRMHQAFIGNTAEKVIDHVACDVLIVKPARFRTSVARALPHLKTRR